MLLYGSNAFQMNTPAEIPRLHHLVHTIAHILLQPKLFCFKIEDIPYKATPSPVILMLMSNN